MNNYTVDPRENKNDEQLTRKLCRLIDDKFN